MLDQVSATGMYGAETLSVLVTYSGPSVNLGRFGAISDGATLLLTADEANNIVGDTRFTVAHVNRTNGGGTCSGDPQGAVIGNVGDQLFDPATRTFYYKESGDATNTGWITKLVLAD